MFAASPLCLNTRRHGAASCIFVEIIESAEDELPGAVPLPCHMAQQNLCEERSSLERPSFGRKGLKKS
jgi:hypothetical protein